MKIVYTEGCTAYGLDVDGNDFNSLTDAEKKRIVLEVIEEIDASYLQDVLIDLCQKCGEYEYQYHCDQCGDDVCDWTLKI